LNGIVSSNIYRTKDAPHFYPGHGTVLGYLTIFLFGGSIVTTLLLRAENKKRVNGQRDNWLEGKTASQLEIQGDKRLVSQYYTQIMNPDCCRPDFLYIV
jgi:hypothetical protein